MKKNENLFYWLNKGMIATTFITIDNYINYIKTTKTISYEYIELLLSVPNVLYKEWVDMYVIEKMDVQNKSVVKMLTRTWLFKNNLMIIIYKNNNFYHPIIKLRKIDNVLSSVKIFSNIEPVINFYNFNE